MKIIRKKGWIAALTAVLIVALLAGGVFAYAKFSALPITPRGEYFAEQRVRRFMDAANGNDPAAVYDFLTAELRGLCSRETFVENWNHERTYPYLIPYWIFYRGVELEPDGRLGTACFERAARLPGQYENYGLVYERGGYYFDAFRSIADGSYIEIFDRLS